MIVATNLTSPAVYSRIVHAFDVLKDLIRQTGINFDNLSVAGKVYNSGVFQLSSPVLVKYYSFY